MLLLALLLACPYITDEEEAERLDPDGDGVPWPEDCAPNDPDVTFKLFYQDADGDGYGDPELVSAERCDPVPGEVDNGDDCDDGDPDVHPGAEEVCGDGVDDNCDGGAWPCGVRGDFYVPEDADLTLEGGTWQAYLGWSLALVDLDGDGDRDLAAAQPNAIYSQTSRPVAVRLYGAPLGRDGTFEGGSIGADTNLYAGYSLDAAEPWQGGASDRLLVGAPSLSTDERVAGEVWLFEAPGLGALSRDDASAVLQGSATTYELFGRDVAVVDASANGTVAASAPSYGSELSGQGRVLLYSGALSGELSTDAAQAELLGATSYGGLGAALAAVGDSDGDGSPELLVANLGGEVVAGQAWLFDGSIEGQLSTDAAMATVTGTLGDHLGRALSGAGDLDGDGYDDLALGAPGAEQGAGAVAVLLGPLGASQAWNDADAVLLGEGSGALGTAVHGPGDLDGDGLSELLLAAPYATGQAPAALLFTGPLLGSLDAADAAARVFNAEETTTGLGLGLAAGDLDLDGAADLILGAPATDVSDGDEGALHILFGLGL